MKRVAAAVLLASVWVACANAGSSSADGFADECREGETQACDCPGTQKGSQSCDGAKGVWGVCDCGSPQLPPADDAGTGTTKGCDLPASDGGVRSSKKCQVCDFDVKPSADTQCPAAPACANGSLGAPAKPIPRDDLTVHLDNGTPMGADLDAGVPDPDQFNCLSPQLRLRVQSFKITKGDSGKGAYCIIEANDGVTSEAAITMKTGPLKAGESFPFPVQQGMMWGQSVPECTNNNLTLSYYCYDVKDNSAWTAALDAMGKAATGLGGSSAGAATGYGWAFGLGGAAAQAAAAGINAATKDEMRIRIQQTISTRDLLDLTNGRTWTIRSSVDRSCGLLCKQQWDWEIEIQAWGCAEKLPDGPR